MLKRSTSGLLIIVAVCCLPILPFFWWGNPSGHDFEFHMCAWMDVLSQWNQGVLYPRWAALADWGYGEATFLFYPPTSWTLGAALGAILPWRAVPGAYCWIALSLAGASMYGLAKRYLPPTEALFAACFYALNPYHLLILYWRSSYAELLAAALLPLVFLNIVRSNEPGWRPTLWLALTLTAAWLTNLPAAVMIHYSAALLAVLFAAWEKSLRPVLRTTSAILMAAILSSFYLIPAVYEQRWVNISEVLSPGVRPQENFLFTPTLNPDHNRFNLLISFVALAEIGALAAALAVSFRRSLNGSRFSKSHLMLLAAWGIATAFVMVSPSNFLWVHSPNFRFVQLPFRWLLCLNASLSLLLVLATRSGEPHRWWTRGIICAVLLAVIIFSGQRTQPPWWETSSDIQEMSDGVADGTGYEGVDEYVPAGADPYELNQNLAQVSDQNGNVTGLSILYWGAIEKHFRVQSTAPRDLTLRLFNYPAWQATVNDKPAGTRSTDVTKLLVIRIPAGEADVRVQFTRTPDRWVGDAVSLLGLGLFSMAWSKTKTKTRSTETCILAA